MADLSHVALSDAVRRLAEAGAVVRRLRDGGLLIVISPEAAFGVDLPEGTTT